MIRDTVKYPHIQAVAMQGSCIYNGQFLSLVWLWGEAGYTTYGRIVQFDYNDCSIKAQFDIATMSSDDEPECLVTMNNEIMMLGYWGEALTNSIITTDGDNNERGIVKYFSQGTNGDNIAIENIYIVGNGQYAFVRIRCRARTQLNVGTSYYARISNFSNMQGSVQGFYGNAPFMGEMFNGQISVRPFVSNISEGSIFNMQGVVLVSRSPS